jgi:hypothetical protein
MNNYKAKEVNDGEQHEDRIMRHLIQVVKDLGYSNYTYKKHKEEKIK